VRKAPTQMSVHDATCVGLISLVVLLTSFGIPLPIPVAALLMAAGAFAAHGEPHLAPLIAMPIAAAVAGDLCGYFAGWIGGRWFISGSRTRAVTTVKTGWRKFWGLRAIRAVGESNYGRRAIARSKRAVQGRSIVSLILLSRTVLTTIGPFVNFMSGVRGYAVARFILYDTIGETAWVIMYIGAGFALGRNLVTGPALVAGMGALLVGPLVIASCIGRHWRGRSDTLAPASTTIEQSAL
jgi:membrane-associated protein